MCVETLSSADIREVKQAPRLYDIELCKQICSRINFEDTTLSEKTR